MACKLKQQIILVAALFIALGLPSHAYAGKKKLSENDVKDFIVKTSAIVSGQEASMSKDDIINYLDDHLEKGARFKSILQYNVPGSPSQETAMNFGKQAFIDNIREGADKIDDFKSEIQILEVKLSSDKSQAFVKTQSNEQAVMPVPNDDGEIENVPLDGISMCDQIITISKKGVIQMFGATCTTMINFDPI